MIQTPWVWLFLVLPLACMLVACEETPAERCVASRMKVWDYHAEKTPWRISESTGETRSQYQSKVRDYCEAEGR
jgi:hypothetical protein